MANTPQISVPELSGVTSLKWSTSDQTASNDTVTTILKGKASFGTLFNNDLLTSLRDSRIGEYGWYAGHNIRHGYGRQYDEIDLTAIELNVNYNKSGYYSRFEVQARTESRPIEEKRDAINVGQATNDETYATWWNHRVVSTTKGESITAADWKAQTDTTAPGSYAGTTARWVKSNQALKSGEYTILEARFPGVQSYGVAALQVKEVIFARTESIMRNVIGAVGYLKVPRNSANEYYDDSLTDATKWIITGASYRKRLGWFEGEVSYAYAKGGWLAVGAESGKSGVYPQYYG